MANNLLYFLSPLHNRSAMAEAWAERANLEDWHVSSSGWGRIERNPLSIKAMREVNIDLSGKPVRRVNDRLLQQASCIVALYDFRHESAPSLPSGCEEKLVKWNVPDPEKASRSQIEMWAKYQEVCDLIAEKVKTLEDELQENS